MIRRVREYTTAIYEPRTELRGNSQSVTINDLLPFSSLRRSLRAHFWYHILGRERHDIETRHFPTSSPPASPLPLSLLTSMLHRIESIWRILSFTSVSTLSRLVWTRGQDREGKGEGRLSCAPVLSFRVVGGGRQPGGILPPVRARSPVSHVGLIFDKLNVKRWPRFSFHYFSFVLGCKPEV